MPGQGRGEPSMSFLTLLRKEMGMLGRNRVLYLLLAVIFVFYWSNYATEESWSEGKPPSPPVEITGQAPAMDGEPRYGDGSQGVPAMPVYGFQKATDPGFIAERYLSMLENDLQRGWMEQRIIFGAFAGKSKLSQSDREHMKESMSRLQEVVKEPSGYTGIEVQQMAADLDSHLGGWTSYMREGVSFREPVETFEDAMSMYEASLDEYEKRVADNGIFAGMARLFSDYMGLTAGLFPVFLAAFMMGRDRSSGMNEIVSSRSIKAWRYVGARYLAHAIIISFLYLLLAAVGAWQTAGALEEAGTFGDALPIFLSYTAGWLLPTILVTLAFGLLISMAVGNGIIAIPLQIVWWFISALPLIGDYRFFKLFLRFNTGAEQETFYRYENAIIANRIFYVLLAVAMVAAAAMIWERKRSSGKGSKIGFGFRRRQAIRLVKNGSEG